MRTVLSLLVLASCIICAALLGRLLVAEPATKTTIADRTPVSLPGRVFLTRAEATTVSAAGLMPENIRSVLKVNGRMKYGDFVWNERGVPAGPISVHVDLRSQLLSVYRGQHEVGSAVILYGADAHQTPLGVYPVMSKNRSYWSHTYDAPMPFAMRLTADGVAIHGSDVRWGAATHGCIGVPSEFAERLFNSIKVGDPVTIVKSSRSPADVRT